jgi:hypothetical protein
MNRQDAKAPRKARHKSKFIRTALVIPAQAGIQKDPCSSWRLGASIRFGFSWRRGVVAVKQIR